MQPTIATGELAGSTSAAQLPDVPCQMVCFHARDDNAGNVYIGGPGVTKPDGTTDATTGYHLDAGEQTPWISLGNLNQLYRICDNAGDDLTYISIRGN